MKDDERTKSPPTKSTGSDQPGEATEATSPAEERGERMETGRQIARGGKQFGHVAGATSSESSDPRAGH